ncbi:antibiotic biosynthesis monooxygenase family protein [Geodermatophilus maliterrae]|uniref:Antibiotic biosynthesis monooxygenase n=1 Tax=Geodermatophilus maliterrae TaxID=3162531 RepID=A0ABV3XL58_9ACTN
MRVIPDLPWTADRPAEGPGVVLVTELHLRRPTDVPAFFAASMAIRRQVSTSPGARSLLLRAQPLARTFTTVSWWDDPAAVRAFARTDPHRSAMRHWAPRLKAFSNRTLPGDGTAPTVDAAVAAAAALSA